MEELKLTTASCNKAKHGQHGKEKNRLQKTKMCAFFKRGRCRHGDQCEYAHADAELEPLPILTKTQLCAAWLSNKCPHTDAECNFAHGEKDLRRVSYRKTEIIVEPKPVALVGKATDLFTSIAPSSPPVVAESVEAKHPRAFDDGEVVLPLPVTFIQPHGSWTMMTDGHQVVYRKCSPVTAFLAGFLPARRPSERLSLVQLASALQQSEAICDDHVLEKLLAAALPEAYED